MENKQINRIMPSVIREESKLMVVGGSLQTILILTMPNETPPSFWLSKLASLNDINYCFEIIPNHNDFLGKIQSAPRNIENRLEQEYGEKKTNGITIKALKKKQETVDKALTEITSGVQKGFKTRLYIQVSAYTETKLNQKIREVKGFCAGLGMIVEPMQNMVGEGIRKFLSSPLDKDPYLDYAYSQDAMTQTMAGAFPFASSSLNDGQGLPVGLDSNNAYCMIDFWARKQGRTNNSIVILGQSGKGKSTLIKRIIGLEIAKGTEIYILDPEREFSHLAKSFPKRATVLDMGGKSDNVINILEINIEGLIATFEKIEDVTIDGLINKHIDYVKDFLLLILGKPENESDIKLHGSIVKQILYETYKMFGFLEFSLDQLRNLKATEYPILDDFLKAARTITKQDVDLTETQKDILANIIYKVKVELRGIGGDLWNNHSTFKKEDKTIFIYDMKSLDSVSDDIKKAQYANILNFAWNMVTRDKTTPCLLVIDEGHMVMDPRLIDVVRRIKEYQKRIRKYNGALIISTQDLGDFRHPEIQTETNAILSNPAYKIFLGMGDEEIKDLTDVYGFSKGEQRILKGAGRGECLIRAGSVKTHIPKIDLFDFEIEKLLGTGGGR